MIEYRAGYILAEDAEALVNTVNCVGIMGRGIALQFKNAFPANFKAYEAACTGCGQNRRAGSKRSVTRRMICCSIPWMEVPKGAKTPFPTTVATAFREGASSSRSISWRGVATTC